MIKTLLATLVLSTTLAVAQDSQVCLLNDAGGIIVLTHENCSSEKVVARYPYRAYATEDSGIVHEGCFDIPSTAEAKPQVGMRIIPVVNFIDVNDGGIVTFKAEWFTPESCTLLESM